LTEKAKIMDNIIRRELHERGHDPDQLIARNVATYEKEEAKIQAQRALYREKIASRANTSQSSAT
jgi:hypothetical protein